MAVYDPIIAAQTPAPDFTIRQEWDAYTDEQHHIWNQLYARQIDILQDRAVTEFYHGLDTLNLNAGGIPELAALNKALQACTGWQVVMVPELVPDEIFFEHLAHRRFPAGRFIRNKKQLDYIQEPDIFHDIFGHVPMLTHPVFADYMQAYGQGGLRAIRHDCLKELARLYWYTVEFGLIATAQGLKIYGAGIVSSHTESLFSLDDPSPHRIGFALERIMRTEYRIDDFQQIYFVIENFTQLFDATQQDFEPLYKHLQADRHSYKIRDILSEDTIYTRGIQANPVQLIA